MEDTRSSRDLLTWMESKIKESKVRNHDHSVLCHLIVLNSSVKVEYTGKIHEIAHVTREQV